MSDFLQGVVWRVPPGGGAAQIWLSDRKLDGGEFGTTGLALAADRRTLLIGQGSSAGLGDGNPATGKIYAVEIKPDGSPGDMRQLWESGPTDLPDGFGVARSGRLYVPLAGTANQIAVVAPDGTEVERFPNSPGGGDNGSDDPLRHTLERPLPGHADHRREPELHRRPRQPGAAGRGGRRSRA